MDAVIAEDILPLHSGTDVVDDPHFIRTVAGSWDDDPDVRLRIAELPDDDVSRKIVRRIAG